MATVKKQFVCKECGATYPKWQGQCGVCKAWNTLEEELPLPQVSKREALASQAIGSSKKSKPRHLAEIHSSEEKRIILSDRELNRTLGGGLVEGSFVLLGGEPGIGKSTLILQTVLQTKGLHTLYISAEESEQQLKMRADRIGGDNEDLLILCETDLETILAYATQIQPKLLVIDSIQTISTSLSESSPGSPSQIRECANLLLRFAKQHAISVVVIGHITKDGTIAGPKVLEHTVDTVLLFEGDKHFFYRILCCQKNRFGSTNELGIYEMRNEGLRGIENPSEHFVSQNDEALSGRCIAVTLEGVRPLLVETQALVSSAVYPNPQRSATGFDQRRLDMLLAVLDKRAGFKLARQDVYLNIAGGLRINDTALDLSIAVAVLSSTLDRAVSTSVCFTGEIGLSGEIRAVSRIEARIGEADRLGYKAIVIPQANKLSLAESTNKIAIKVLAVKNISELARLVFKNSTQ